MESALEAIDDECRKPEGGQPGDDNPEHLN